MWTEINGAAFEKQNITSCKLVPWQHPQNSTHSSHFDERRWMLFEVRGKGKGRSVTLQHAKHALNGCNGIALPIHNLGAKSRRAVRVTTHPLYAPDRNPVPISREAGWASGCGLKGCRKSRPSGFEPRTFQTLASSYIDWAIPAGLWTWSVTTLWINSSKDTIWFTSSNIGCKVEYRENNLMSLALLFQYLMFNMFRMLMHPSSGTCDLFVELFHGL